MAQIICLANSYKSGGRCIAGIDPQTKAWVRPVSNSINRAVSLSVVTELGLRILDIVEIPLDDTGPDEGCQPENRLIKRGAWKKVGRISTTELLPYCEDNSLILHNHLDRVPPAVFRKKPKSKWKSLQLVLSKDVKFFQNPWGKWCVSFSYGKQRMLDLKLTDPVALERLRQGQQMRNKCILTISMGTPYKRQPNDIEFCWKMVAGVIEL